MVKVGGIQSLRPFERVRRAGRFRQADPTSDASFYPVGAERRTAIRPPLHFQRIELKYFLPYRWIEHFVERISPFTEIDPYLVREGRGRTRYPVTSLYFDSWDLQAWREKEDGQFFRRKVRLRTYEEEFSHADPCFLEIKRRLDAVVLKDRIRLPAGVLREDMPETSLMRDVLDVAGERDATSMEAHLMLGWLNLRPTAIVRYQRLALTAREDRNIRITVDHHLQGTWRPPSILGTVPLRSIDNINATGTTGISGKYAILEIKSNNIFPAWLHRAIQELELSRTAYSKYYLVVLALRPTLGEDCDERFAVGSDV